MQAPFKVKRRVEFRDTDAAGIMHFSAFFTYMEEAEHELLRSLGTSVVLHAGGSAGEEGRPGDGEISWPRVAAACQFSGSAHFEDDLTIEVQVERIGRSSVTYLFRFLVDDQKIADGSMTSVRCHFPKGGSPNSVAIPDILRGQLASYEA